MKLRLSKQAVADLEEVWLYGAIHWSETRADRMMAKLRAKITLLARHPRIGRWRAELGEDFRSLVVSPFVVFYRTPGRFVEIVRVLHAARDPEGLL